MTNRVNTTTLAAALAKQLGPCFEPGKRAEIEKPLAELLAKQLSNVDRASILPAVSDALRRIRIAVDWKTIICIILGGLPGWWTKVTNNPGFQASTMLLLTDGTVMVQAQGGKAWKRLTPDAHGNYINGTWSDLAPMANTRRFFASAVLKDGRVFVSGGEYSDAGDETTKTEIYDPLTDTWSATAQPPSTWSHVGDAPCAVLPDGTVFVGNIDSNRTAIYDPVADTWTDGPTKAVASSEESWALLGDDTVITVRCDFSNVADKYVVASNSWVGASTVPVGLIETSSSEIGAAVVLPDGRAFYAGATGHTALYTAPATASDPGSWAQGPDFPNDANGQTVGCKDTPSCLMTNGKVLVTAGPVDGVWNHWLTPTYFFEFNGTSLKRVADPPNATNVPYIGRMLLLPTGQIAYAAETDAVYVYSYYGCINDAWRPRITSAPGYIVGGGSYNLAGTQLNGLSQAVGYGDDVSAATNYPLVRIHHLASGNVTYCRTHDHSTMAIATGTAVESTQFTVPFGTPSGPSELCVVANGISSPCVNVDVGLLRPPYHHYEMWLQLIGSLADGPLLVLGPNGPIPVDPWGPAFEKPAAAARKQALDGLRELRKLGLKLFQERANQALAAEPAKEE